mgnify:CR=1 FL=1
MALYRSINEQGINLSFVTQITKGFGYLEVLDASDNVKGFVKSQNEELVTITDLVVGRTRLNVSSSLTATADL